jgi:hypothetical protein
MGKEIGIAPSALQGQGYLPTDVSVRSSSCASPHIHRSYRSDGAKRRENIALKRRL